MFQSRIGAATLLLSLTTVVGMTVIAGPQGEQSGQTGPNGSDAAPPKNPYRDLPFDHPPTLTGVLPRQVPFLDQAPSDPTAARPFFDNFSWRSFVALNWPVDPKDRGQPRDPKVASVFRGAKNGYPSVWGSYREAFELFSQGDQTPPPWDGGLPANNPCGAKEGERTFVMVTKGGSVLDEINQAFSYPLIDQNREYAHYEVRFNQAQYSKIRDTRWYLVRELAKAEPVMLPMSLPGNTQVPNWVGDGSIMVKAAWRRMTDDDVARGRYYMITANLFLPQPPTPKEKTEGTPTDPVNTDDGSGTAGTCIKAQVGLVGFHIARKIEDFPQWIWSTFEQVDNLSVPPGADFKPSFNNGTDTPKTVGGWADRPAAKAPQLQPKDQRVPVQVTRLNPIPTTPKDFSTVDLNAIYQKALAGTVWQYYDLVATQWPSDQTGAKLLEQGGIYPDSCGHAFPANGIVNTSAETYVQSLNDAQGAGGNSCMSCHYRAGQADFSWVLMDRAH